MILALAALLAYYQHTGPDLLLQPGVTAVLNGYRFLVSK